MPVHKLDYRCLAVRCTQATKCRRFLMGDAAKNSTVRIAAFDSRRTPDACDGFLPRITSPLPDAERKALDAACSTSL